MAFLHDIVTELSGSGTASTGIAVLGILIVTALVAVVLVLSLSRSDHDPRSHPRRTRHLVRH
jgi:hypothetical protein